MARTSRPPADRCEALRFAGASTSRCDLAPPGPREGRRNEAVVTRTTARTDRTGWAPPLVDPRRTRIRWNLRYVQAAA